MSAAQAFFEANFPGEVAGKSLSHPAAAAMARLLDSGAYSGATLCTCRQARGQAVNPELLIVDVEVALGQRATVNDIRSVERIGIAYGRPDILPAVYPLRDDFPVEVPHLNLAGRGMPRSLCLFDMPPEEALRLSTPFVLIERVRFWMRETAYGRLHGDDQPLDPVFLGAAIQLILPHGMDEQIDMFLAFRRSDRDDAPVILSPVDKDQMAGVRGMSVIVIETKSLPHGRLREVPVNVAELIEAYRERGIDLVPAFITTLRAWLPKPHWKQLSDRNCLIILRTPLEREPGRVDGLATKAFFTDCKAGELAERLGAFHEASGFVGVLLTQPPIDIETLRKLALAPMDVYRPFDRAMALSASGVGESPNATKRVLLVGAGALGSQIALTAARMGLGSWTIVDADYLLPHNMARHALSHFHVGRPKADALAYEIRGLLGEGAASSLVAGIEDSPGDVLSSAEMVIDTSASVPAARWIATASTHLGRTCSAFLNPTGTDLVLLVEGEGRRPRLDHVEMSYYWALASGEGPEGHLSSGKIGLFPSGGCRRASLAISQADIGALAPLAVKRLLQYPLPARGLVEILTLTSANDAVFSHGSAVYSETDLGGWTLAVSGDVLDGIVADRKAADGLETGGILVGTWDRVRRRVYVVGRYAPPPDSLAGPTSFVRGAEGVYQTLETVERLTAGNLTYIGEWHTHPIGYGSQPSADDRTLLRWIGDVLIFSDVPAIMLIAGADGVRAILGRSEATCSIPHLNAEP